MSEPLPFDIVELVACAPSPNLDPSTPLAEMAYRADAWLPDDDRTLIELFHADVSLEEMATQLQPRTRGAISRRLYDLGLRRNSVRSWTELDDEFLTQHYGRTATSELAAFLARSPTAIYARARLLGLTEGNPPAWSSWEDAQLRAGYRLGTPIPQLAVLIGRPASGISSRAASLGVRHKNKPEDWTEEEQTRALELAESGMRYLKIAKTLTLEGWPARSKVSVRQLLHKLGYERGWGRLWTPEEDELLRQAYQTGTSLTPLLARLGRTKHSIRWRSGYLGLQGTHPNHNGFRLGRSWTDAEDIVLRRDYGNVPTREIAAALNRPRGGVLQRAWVLGLKHGYHRDFSTEEDQAIRTAHAAAISLTDLAEALGRDPSVVSKRAHSLGIRFSSRDNHAPRNPRASREKLTLAGILAIGERPRPTQELSQRSCSDVQQ